MWRDPEYAHTEGLVELMMVAALAIGLLLGYLGVF